MRDEAKKIVSSLDVELEASLKETYPRNLKTARERVIKENVHLVERVQRHRNKKWRKFENRVGITREKLEGNSDPFKFVNISDRQRRERQMLINETKSGVSALPEAKVVPSQRDVSLNSASNAMDILSQGKEINS